MTNIIVGQNISGSLTSTNPTIVDPTSPFNGQFYDDFDLSSVNVIDPSNIPFLLAASKELGDIGSVKIGETRSTNIFIQPPAGSAPGASTTIQLINTKTNSVDAQATSSNSEALKFVKNAEIVGSDYKVRVINATPGDYQISLAGAIQSVQVVGTTGTTPVAGAAPIGTTVDPNIARNLIDGQIYDSTGAVIGAARGIPVTQLPPTTDIPISIDPPTGNPLILTLPEESIPLVLPLPPKQIPIVLADNQPYPTPENMLPRMFAAVPPESQVPVVDPPVGDNQPAPIRGTNPQPNERGPITTDPQVDPALSEIDPRIFQTLGGSIPPGAVANTSPGVAFQSPAPPFSLNGNFLTVRRDSRFGISAISQKPGNKVNEIGIFELNVNPLGAPAPGVASYLKAVTNSARSIFSTLGGNFFESSSKREVFLEANKTYGFFQVQDGSIADLKQQLANGQTPTNVLLPIPGANGVIPIQLTGNSKDPGADFFGEYKLSVNKDELVLNVTSLNGATPAMVIGAKSQGLAEGRTIDLTGITGTRKVDITTKSSAAYNNNIGFYKVEDSIGTIRLADGTTVKPGDARYALEAVKNALANTSLQAGKTESKLGQNITGGAIYAPVVISQGSLSDFVTANPTNIGGSSNNAYFNYVLGNSDKQDHFRLLGDNTFGVEDQLGGGDRDFNDLVVNMNVKPA
jgi:Domain of unknown function (DUF4114)